MNESRVYRVGEATITKVNELTLDQFTLDTLLPAWQPAAGQPAQVPVQLSVHTWVIKTPQHIILIDTGAGNDKTRPFTPYFDHLHLPYLVRLRAVGVAPEAVDYVLLTHLHVDHVGWNTRWADGRWVPTFPNARYVFAQAEYAYFTDPANHNERNKTSFLVQPDSVTPLVAAGLAEQIAVDGRPYSLGFSFHPTPGHSPHHASIVLTLGGETALFAGDVLHHPVQVEQPNLNSVFDAQPEPARASRQWVLAYAADHQALVFSSHLADSSVGRVSRQGRTGFAWQFV